MDRRIIYIKKYLQLNFSKRNHLSDLAKLVNLSPAHLRELFKAEIGLSPVQYIQNIRLEKACELLENSFSNIKQIAYFVGINDQSNFTHAFKAKYGTTPLEYRNKNVNEFK